MPPWRVPSLQAISRRKKNQLFMPALWEQRPRTAKIKRKHIPDNKQRFFSTKNYNFFSLFRFNTIYLTIRCDIFFFIVFMNIIFPIKFFFNISKHWLMLFFAVVASFIIGWWKKRTKLFYISKQLGYFLHEGFFCIAIKVKVCMQDINHLAKKTTCSRKNNTINSIYCCYNQGKWRNNSSHIILTLKMSFKTFFF